MPLKPILFDDGLFEFLSLPKILIVRDQDHLCSQCKNLDLDEFFLHKSQSLVRLPFPRLLDFADIIRNSQCPLCRLFQRFCPPWFPVDSRNYFITIRPLRKQSKGTEMLRELDASSAEKLLAVAYYFRLRISLKRLYAPITDTGCILKFQYPARHTGGIKSSQTNLLNSEVNFTQLKSWLDECSESHSCAKFTESKPIAGMRVIDVYTRDIVPATPGFDYAALSYVWGAGEKETAQVGFPNTAPKTIEDALEVTKRLGMSYLWVDRYCIRQDRKDEKHDQISKMHLIYRNACITIIAAAGSGPEHGIPGVRGTSRIPQPHAELEDGLLVVTFPHPTSVIKKSKWASRGWTYQEAALSRRRLAFTEYGAYFECNGHSLSEGIEEPIRQMTSKSPRKLQPRLCGGISAWSSHSIWQHINEFSKRDISYQEDRMNAFLGIFGALERSKDVKGHLWGIPIKAFSTSHFLENLMWESKGPTERNIQFPSWSWTGWKGEVGNKHPRYVELLPQENLYVNSSRVHIFVELFNGDTISLENYSYGSWRSIKKRLPSKYLHIRAPTFKCRFSRLNPERQNLNGLGCWYNLSLVDFMHTRKLILPSIKLFTLWQTEGTNLEERLASETWDVIFWQVYRDKAFFLVLYKLDDYVERFGHFWGDFHVYRELKPISEDRIFRLG